MPLWQTSVLIALRVLLGLAILTTFATVIGVGVGRQAALEGAFSPETREAFSDGSLLVWLRTGGPVLLAALAFAGAERWLTRRWGGD